MDHVREVVTERFGTKLAVGLANPELLPPVVLSAHVRDGMFSLFLTEGEARELAAALTATADECDEAKAAVPR